MKKHIHAEDVIGKVQDRIAQSVVNKRLNENTIDDVLTVIDYIGTGSQKALATKLGCSLSMARDRYNNGLSVLMAMVSDFDTTTKRIEAIMDILDVSRNMAINITEIINRRERRDIKKG